MEEEVKWMSYKERLLLDITELLATGYSIKTFVDRIYNIRTKLTELLTDEEMFNLTNRIKSRVQNEAISAWIHAGRWGAVYMATGSGKSKIGVDIADNYFKKNNDTKEIIVVPTEKLRDENWPNEFTKWGKEQPSGLRMACYASISKIHGHEIDLAILDEGHNITPNNFEFFKQNKVNSCLLLSATKPRDPIKIELLKTLKINPVYEISLDEAVKLGLVSPYEITIIEMKLDNIDKYLQGGSKAKPFMTTEKSKYDYLTKRCMFFPNKMSFIDRMWFIYDLRSKTNVAKWVLEKIIPPELRTLIFCGSRRQATQLCDRTFFSKPSKPTLKKGQTITDAKLKKLEKEVVKYAELLDRYEGDNGYNDFVQKKINRLACAEALNEGHNLNDVDCGFIVQLNSSQLDLVQRIGRTIRFRPGHSGKIIILAVMDTEDNNWVSKATSGLEAAKITRVELSKLVKGTETITFN